MARARRQSVGGIEFPRVVFIMDPTPQQLTHDLVLLERQISDYNKPLAYSKQEIIADVRRTFELERDPETGLKWQRLSDRAARVPRYGILRRKITRAAMYRSVTNSRNYRISREGVTFNQRSLPEYAVYHQQDERAQGASKTVSVPKHLIAVRAKQLLLENRRAGKVETGRETVARAQSQLEDELGAAAKAVSGKIPQRRFMGVSPVAQGKIRTAFDEWAKDAIIIYRRGGKHVRARRPSSQL